MGNKKNLLVALFIFLAIAPRVSAATVTVSPGQSIQSAVNAAASGETITVQPGSYNEKINLSKSNITLKASGKVNTKAISVTGNGNTVFGFTISDAAADAGITVKANNNLFENNEIFHTGQDGIWFFGTGNTFRGNYIHDILDPSIGGDPHVDCFQSWGWNWDTYNVLFENNICDHTRSTGSNQIVQLARNTQVEVRDITFRNNNFIMHDAGYSPLNLSRDADQLPLSNIIVAGNTFCNTTGSGQDAIRIRGVTHVEMVNNTYTGYTNLVNNSGGTDIINTGNVRGSLPCQTPTSVSKPGDLNADNNVDIFDYNILVANFGTTYTIFDYNILVTNYGK